MLYYVGYLIVVTVRISKKNQFQKILLPSALHLAERLIVNQSVS